MDKQNGSAPHDTEEVREPIAIVGMACRYPGGSNSPEAFWKMLCEGRDCIREITPDRWSLRALYDPEPGRSGKTYSRHAGLIDGIDQFDPHFFGISPRDAQAMDPQQRLLLETAWEAMEDAGILPERLAGSAAGVFVGISTHDYGDLMSAPTERTNDTNPYVALGSALCIAANRISYCFDLRGPSFAVDTACSSSLVALHLACESIRKGESSLAFVGGSNAILKPETTLGFSAAGMLSPDGRCKSFDARANGYVRAEGAGMLLLKPLSSARRDGDRIYCVVLASAVNQDGLTPGISVPSGDAQAALVRQACARAGVRPQDIQFIEAHGTGTPVGDPIEAAALGSVVGLDRDADSPCLLGSVKSNIGHLEAGAGVAGVMKAALAIHHGCIPPNLHFEAPSPQIDMEALRLRVPTQVETWPQTDGNPRLAGVNSFGFGGSNAHALLAETPRDKSRSERNGAGTSAANRTFLLPLSARSKEALEELAKRHRDFLANRTDLPLTDIVWTASLRRSHHAHRLALVAESRAKAAEQLETHLAGERVAGISMGRSPAAGRPRLVFVFTGMGPQWWAMGQQLLREEPTFRAAIERCDRMFRKYMRESLLEELSAAEEHSRIHDDRFAQMGIFALQVGLAALWESWGIKPDVIVGHSVGEVAAAHVAGALTLEDAVLVSFHRSRLQHRTRGQGRMLAIGLSVEEARRLLVAQEAKVSIAAINGPQAVTLAGESGTLEMIHDELTVEGTFSRFLKVDVPYHSPQMDGLRDELLEVLAALTPVAPNIPLFSTATCEPVVGPAMNAAYWWKNVREPVQFAAAMEKLLQEGNSLFLEIGPHPVLASSIQECALACDTEVTVLATLRRGEPERATMLSALGRFYTAGFDVAWSELFPGRGHHVTLPAYPWQRERCWRESPIGSRFRTGEAGWSALGHFGPSVHPLLGHALVTAHTEPAWDNELDVQRDHFWIADHRVQGAIVFPAAAHVEMALAAGAQLSGAEFAAIESLELDRPLFLTAGAPQPVQLLIDRSQKSFALHGKQTDGPWVRYSAGRLERLAQTAAPDRLDTNQLFERCFRSIDRAACYELFRNIGLEYGPAFAGIQQMWTGPNEAVSRIAMADTMLDRIADFIVCPAVLDAAFQTLLGTMEGNTPRLYLPSRIRRIRVLRPLTQAHATTRTFWSHARLTHRDDASLEGNITIADEQGNVLVEVEGLRCRALAEKTASSALALDRCFHHEVWLLQPAIGEFPSDTAAWRLPRPIELADALRPALAAQTSHGDRPYRQSDATARLQQLSLAYIFDAFRRLGWKSSTAETEPLEALVSRLHIAPSQIGLFRRLLTWLQAEGLVRQSNDGRLEFLAPQSLDVAELARRCAIELAAYHPRLLLIQALGSRLPEILRGEVDPTTILNPGDSQSPLANLMQSDPAWRACNSALTNALLATITRVPTERPLRILEIGGGAAVLAALLGQILPPQHITYCLTDPSPENIARARERFGDNPAVNAEVLDPMEDPIAQGFKAHYFDLVLGCGVAHSSVDMARMLGSIKSLLGPGGLVLLAEPVADFVLTVLGPLPDAARLANHTPQHDFSRPQWASAFQASGFDAVDVLIDGSTREAPTNALVIAQGPAAKNRVEDSTAGRAPGDWLILADRGGRGEQLAGALKELGARVVLATQGDAFRQQEEGIYQVRPDNAEDLERLFMDGLTGASSWTGIACLWALDLPGMGEVASPELLDRQAEVCASVVEVARLAIDPDFGRPPRLCLITQCALPVGPTPVAAPEQAVLWGMGRVLANEHPEIRCSLIDLGRASADEVEALARELWQGGREDEVGLRGTDRYVHRLVPLDPIEPVNAMQPSSAGTGSRVVVPYHLVPSQFGLVDDLTLQAVPRGQPGRGQVEIEVHATPLNFKDVAKALHLLGEASLEGTYSGTRLGLECAGRVVAVGEGAEGFACGDDVVGLAAGSFASHVLADVRALAHKPAHLTFEEAATLPVVFLTVHYGLHHLARLQPGERVLIHSASGGVGLAAIQLANLFGAEVYATAGSPQKRDFLRSLGVKYVMDSRSLDFADEVLARTNGEGVDVVLNSLGGETLVRSLSLLRECGRFVELGKRDLEFNAKVGLRPFLKQLSFFAVDLDRLVASRPDLCRQLVGEVMQLVEQGKLRPLPHVVWPISQAREAFRTLLKARHIGKVVLSLQETHVPVVPALPPTPCFREDGTYVMTGGMGGFGLACARWLVEHGARHLLLVGRSGAASAAAQEAIAHLRQAGATVVAALADVSLQADVRRVLEEARKTMPPIRGVFHAAMVLDDAPLLELNRQRFLRVFGPKVAGAWNLHAETRQDPIEHFVLFSSCAALVGNPAQASYAAANVFLDALAHHRRSLGLPALAVDWGVVRDVGVVAERAALARHLENLGLIPLAAREMLDAMGLLLGHGAVQSSVLRADWSLVRKNFPVLEDSPRLILLRSHAHEDQGEAGSKAGDSPRQALLALAPAARHAWLQTMVCEVVARVMGTSPTKLDTQEPMTRIGMDSLMAVELATRIKKELQIDIPTMTFMRGPSIGQLTTTLLQLLLPGVAVAAPPDTDRTESEALPRTAHASSQPHFQAVE